MYLPVVPRARKVFSLLGCQAKSAMVPRRSGDPSWRLRSVTEASPSSALTDQLMISRRTTAPLSRTELASRPCRVGHQASRVT